MRMDDETLKRILKEGMEYEADCIINEVNSDPNLQDVIAPENMYANIKEEIQRIKDAEAKAQAAKAKEEQELIRLGKIYRKNRSRRKYIVLIAAVVCALGVGTISFGDGKKVFTEIKGMLSGKNHTRVNDGDDEKFDGDITASEEEAYEQISEKFGFWPVRMYYMPEGLEFVETVIEENVPNVRLYYEKGTESVICCTIWPNYQDASIGIDVEDKVVKEYSKEVENVLVDIKEYQIPNSDDTKWRVMFKYNDAQYYLLLTGIKQQDVEKIVENLYFS